jgi:hypothetical protein
MFADAFNRNKTCHLRLGGLHSLAYITAVRLPICNVGMSLSGTARPVTPVDLSDRGDRSLPFT